MAAANISPVTWDTVASKKVSGAISRRKFHTYPEEIILTPFEQEYKCSFVSHQATYRSHENKLSFASNLSCNSGDQQSSSIDLYHAMLKQKILPVSPLIQARLGGQKQSFLFPLDSKWPPCDKGLW